MDDQTMLIIGAAIVAGLALSGGLTQVGTGVNNLATSTGIAVTDVTGFVPWIEQQISGLETDIAHIL